MFWIQYNQVIFVAIGVIVLLFYYCSKWRSVDKMPLRKDWVATKASSAASLRYLYKEFVDIKLLTTILISMAVKKTIGIKRKNSIFYIDQIGKGKNLTEEEKLVYESLFANNRQSVEIDYDTSDFWEDICKEIKFCMAKQYYIKDYFKDRSAFMFDSRVFSITLSLVWLVLTYLLTNTLVFSDVLRVSIIGTALSVLLYARYSLRGYDRFRHILLSCLVYFFSLILLLLFFQPGISIKLAVVFVFCIIGFNVYFTQKFKKPTSKGEYVMNEIESIRHYIKNNQRSRLSKEQIDAILPYAVALDEDKEFDKLLKQQNKIDWYRNEDVQEQNKNFLSKLSKRLTYQIASLCSKKMLYSKK